MLSDILHINVSFFIFFFNYLVDMEETYEHPPEYFKEF